MTDGHPGRWLEPFPFEPDGPDCLVGDLCPLVVGQVPITSGERKGEVPDVAASRIGSMGLIGCIERRT
jgi:hypothetical protein